MPVRSPHAERKEGHQKMEWWRMQESGGSDPASKDRANSSTELDEGAPIISE